MNFSVCIPNFNYEKYLGRTIDSVLAQTDADFELLVSDNASTDKSVDVIRGYTDPRLQLRINRCNVGFSSNLDRAAQLGHAPWMIMLSSDDLMRPDALAVYRQLFQCLGGAAERAIVSSTWDLIDSQDVITGQSGPEAAVWKKTDRAPELEAVVGAPVYSVDARELLGRCLRTMKNPFNFAATCYPRSMYEAIEGYGGGRLFGPDKWFHWRLLAKAERAYFVDRPLFAYRWHNENQSAQQSAVSALKYLVDEYVSTLELDAATLALVGMTKDDLINSFVEHDIVRHALATLARGDRSRARRILQFGRAVYPSHVRQNRHAWMLSGLLRLGVVGQRTAQGAYSRYNRQKPGDAK